MLCESTRAQYCIMIQIANICSLRLCVHRAPGKPSTLTCTQHQRMPARYQDVYIHMVRLRMDDHLTRLRIDNELPPANEVERALRRAIDENWWKKQVSESFRAVMLAIIERAVKRGHEMDAYDAIRIFNRSYTELTYAAIRDSRPGRYYVQDKLEWISHKLVQKSEKDWSVIIGLIRPLRNRIAPERYVKLVAMYLHPYDVPA